MAYKYFTKSFTDPDKIDKWLNGFDKSFVSDNPNIKGYAVWGSVIIITVMAYENEKVDLTKMPKRGDK